MADESAVLEVASTTPVAVAVPAPAPPPLPDLTSMTPVAFVPSPVPRVVVGDQLATTAAAADGGKGETTIRKLGGRRQKADAEPETGLTEDPATWPSECPFCHQGAMELEINTHGIKRVVCKITLECIIKSFQFF